MGIDAGHPRLSWTVVPIDIESRGLEQTAYQVLVASTPEKLARVQGDLWDSGKVCSDRTIHMEYAGQPLRTRMRCHWKVRVWDENGNSSA